MVMDKGNMNKPSCILLGIGLLASCGGKELRVDKIIEEGVEVVLNHIEPYRIKGQPTTFSLEEILSIDLEREDFAGAGLMSGGEWDADDDGNMFVVGFKNSENFIYRFDRAGLLTGSFGRRGQGPGELSGPSLSGVYGEEIALSDFLSRKIVVYDLDGRLLRERRLEHPDRLSPLGNGGFVGFGPQLDAAAKAFSYALTLRDAQFNEIKVLDRYAFPLDDSRQVPFFMWRISGDQIIVANEARGYELWIHDLNGRLIRKVRKEYRPVRVTEEIKKAILGPDYWKSGSSQSRYFSDPLPPLNQFFTDDKGRIFVMTYEPGVHPGEYIWDIFNPEGVFIGRVALDILWSGLYLGSRYMFIKKDRLYYHRVKESGYHELVVARVLWR
jgi:6-bladed beta-propeller